MTKESMQQAIKGTKVFQDYPQFKKNITLLNQNLVRLHDLYGQADRLGIDYLKQRTNLMSSDVKLIEELLNQKKN